MIVENYLNKTITTFQSGYAREHAYRPHLQELFEKITNLNLINDPKRSEFGAPDFIFLKNKIIICYAEAKDLTESLNATVRGEQIKRYFGYSNLIVTNGLEFRFYRNGIIYNPPIVIAQLQNGNITSNRKNFQFLEDTLKAFVTSSIEPIISGSHLASVMAGKARRIRENILQFLSNSDQNNSELLSIYNVIKKLLLPDLDFLGFADMYAQTLVYGLFVARFFDSSPENFSRQEARDLIPKSNPFLRQFFDHIAGINFDKRIEMIVQELCEEFCHANVEKIVHNFYKTDKDENRDPIIHFYEDFLQEYDAEERKKMGVFYTPLPVVRFIVNSVDEILITEFGVIKGLASDEKVLIERKGVKTNVKDSVHKIQILDPAIGTGSFLNEVIIKINSKFKDQMGTWNNYVNESLLTRLHGFEIMMASYTIAHLKLTSTLMETGANIKDQRIGVYLTNTLEKGENDTLSLFEVGLGKAITSEGVKASLVKNNLPIMIVLGNPPYSAISLNNTEFASNLVKKYKVEVGGKVKLIEKKHWLNDDYVKFISFSEDLIERNQEGIISMITPHSYIDNPTFRGMRWHLRKTFDKIFILDLHGNARKKEVSQDGTIDSNVFDIMTGVSIILAIKNKSSTKKVNSLGDVYVSDIYGSKEKKLLYLDQNSISSVNWKKLPNSCERWKEESSNKNEYLSGFSLKEIFLESATGFVTANDSSNISFTKDEQITKIQDLISLHEDTWREKYKRKKDSRDWKYENAKLDAIINKDKIEISKVSYRPFDFRYSLYTGKSRGLYSSPQFNGMKNMIPGIISRCFLKDKANNLLVIFL